MNSFWMAQTLIPLFGMTGVTIMVVSILRTIFNSPTRKAKAEIMKKQAFAEIRDERIDLEILERLRSVEQLVSIQNDEIKKLAEENEFFRRLLSDKVEKK